MTAEQVYALLKKKLVGVASGISNVTTDTSGNIVFTTKDGQTFAMPIPKDQESIDKAIARVEKFMQNAVVVSNTQPTDSDTIIWFNEDAEEVEIPTMEDIHNAFPNEIKSAVVEYLEENEIDITTTPMVKITYEELKALRDNGELIPGMQYRLTDYKCGTIQENTRALDHKFDIIITADDERTLNSECRACQHEGEDYFKDCDLTKWKVWYTIDIEDYTFAYRPEGCEIMGIFAEKTGETITHDGITYGLYLLKAYGLCLAVANNEAYIMENGEIIFESGAMPCTVFEETIADCHGVVFRMIDEWKNDVPYDFKNIQFIRYKINGCSYDQFEDTYFALGTIRHPLEKSWNVDTDDYKWLYTFCYPSLDEDLTVGDIINRGRFAYDNKILEPDYYGKNLPNTIFVGNSFEKNTTFSVDTTFGYRTNLCDLHYAADSLIINCTRLEILYMDCCTLRNCEYIRADNPAYSYILSVRYSSGHYNGIYAFNCENLLINFIYGRDLIDNKFIRITGWKGASVNQCGYSYPNFGTLVIEKTEFSNGKATKKFATYNIENDTWIIQTN